MGSLGPTELILIFVIALIIFGPKKLPELGKSLGRMMSEFRRASNDLKRTIEDEVEADRMRELKPATPAAPLDQPGTPSAAATDTASAALPGEPVSAGGQDALHKP